jgi:hypothetical protein
VQDISNTTAPLLAQAELALSRSDLRWEFANAAAAAALLSIAFAAIALFFFRPETRDLTLIYFSLFSILYAVRLLAHLPSFRSLFDASPMFWSYLSWFISSILFFPGALYLYQIVGDKLRRFRRWLIAARALYAVFEIPAAALGVSVAKLGVANNIKVLATLVAIAVYAAVSGLRPGPRTRLTREVRILVAGFVVCLLCILHTNLVGLKILPGRNLELLGCLVFVACLILRKAAPESTMGLFVSIGSLGPTARIRPCENGPI